MWTMIRFSILLPLLFTLCRADLLSSVIINEIMKDPVMVPDSDGEWFELHNDGELSVDLSGWVIRDSGRDHYEFSSDSTVTIAPGAYFVLGRESDPAVNGGYTTDHVYDGITLSNGEDEIVLLDETGAVVDSVAYGRGDWPDGSGKSLEFVEDLLDNGAGGNWVLSSEGYGDGDMGTPGTTNSSSTVSVGGDDHRRGEDDNGDACLLRNYPNPFSGSTSILLDASTPAMRERLEDNGHLVRTTLKVYDLRGRLLRDLWDGGIDRARVVVWNGKDDNGLDLAPGIYILRLEGEGVLEQRKMVYRGR